MDNCICDVDDAAENLIKLFFFLPRGKIKAYAIFILIMSKFKSELENRQLTVKIVCKNQRCLLKNVRFEDLVEVLKCISAYFF